MTNTARYSNHKRSAIAKNSNKLGQPDVALALIISSLDDDKAIDAKVINMAGKSSIADFMVIASGASQRQIKAMADHLIKKLKSAKLSKLSVEGRAQSDWVLIDAGDIIVHLFKPEVRKFYNLEKMWKFDSRENADSTVYG